MNNYSLIKECPITGHDEQIKYLKEQGIGEDCLRKIMDEVEGFKKFIKLSFKDCIFS